MHAKVLAMIMLVVRQREEDEEKHEFHLGTVEYPAAVEDFDQAAEEHKKYYAAREQRGEVELGDKVEAARDAPDAEHGERVKVEDLTEAHHGREGLWERRTASEEVDRLEVDDQLRVDHQDRQVLRGRLVGRGGVWW